MPHRRQGYLAAIAAFLPLAASCVPVVQDARPAIAADPAARLVPPAQIYPPPAVSRPAQVAGTTGAAPPFHLPAGDQAQIERATDCLTAAIYYEARSEGEAGQRAVAQVVLNRVRHRAYPATICGVVFQHVPGQTCQFTFSCDGSMRARREPAAWAGARRIAEQALAGSVYAPVGLSTHYHTRAVSPGWGRRLAQVTTIGEHIFYGGRNAGAQRQDLGRRASAPEPVARPATRARRAESPPPARARPAPLPARLPHRPLPEPGFDFSDEALAGLSTAGPGGGPAPSS